VQLLGGKAVEKPEEALSQLVRWAPGSQYDPAVRSGLLNVFGGERFEILTIVGEQGPFRLNGMSQLFAVGLTSGAGLLRCLN